MKKVAFVFFFTTALFWSCRKENACDCIKRTGDIVKEARTLNFTSHLFIESSKINVYLKQAPVYTVEVEAGKNLIGLIETETAGDTLFIRNKNRCNIMRSYKPQVNIYISTPDISYIKHYGAGKLIGLNTINTNNLTIFTMSSCDIYLDVNMDAISTHIHKTTYLELKGKVNRQVHYMSHNATLNARQLQNGYTWITNNSTGNAYLATNAQLDVNIHKNGDVYYSGAPTQVHTNITGTGKLIKEQ